MALLGATSLTGCNSIPQFIAGVADVGASASRTIFRMATSPVSWTKDTAAFDGMLRITNAASLSPGGSLNFPAVFTSSVPLTVTLNQNAIGLTVNTQTAFPGFVLNTGNADTPASTGATVSEPQITSHVHDYISPQSSFLSPNTTANHASPAQSVSNFSPAGQGQSHNHGTQPHDHPLLNGQPGPHGHSISGQHAHTVTSTQNFSVNYVDIIVSIKD